MRYWVANTDVEWFRYLAARAQTALVDEVNFWSGSRVPPISLPLGGPWLFKLHNRDGGWIVGGGYFATFTTITARFAWDAFLQKNGAEEYPRFLARLSRYTPRGLDPDRTPIGSAVIVQPYFLPPELWIDPPSDWSPNLTRGKSYDTTVGEGALLWERVQAAVASTRVPTLGSVSDDIGVGYGDPVLVRPRLGQGAFRVMVTDAFDRRCAVTNERTLPVLEAAHIKPYRLTGRHEVANGLLLRSDLHTLFDRGYVTVTPDMRLRVSRRIHEEFENGRDYYALDRREVSRPRPPNPPPSRESLEWHADTVFLG